MANKKNNTPQGYPSLFRNIKKSVGSLSFGTYDEETSLSTEESLLIEIATEKINNIKQRAFDAYKSKIGNQYPTISATDISGKELEKLNEFLKQVISVSDIKKLTNSILKLAILDDIHQFPHISGNIFPNLSTGVLEEAQYSRNDIILSAKVRENYIKNKNNNGDVQLLSMFSPGQIQYLMDVSKTEEQQFEGIVDIKGFESLYPIKTKIMDKMVPSSSPSKYKTEVFGVSLTFNELQATGASILETSVTDLVKLVGHSNEYQKFLATGGNLIVSSASNKGQTNLGFKTLLNGFLSVKGNKSKKYKPTTPTSQSIIEKVVGSFTGLTDLNSNEWEIEKRILGRLGISVFEKTGTYNAHSKEIEAMSNDTAEAQNFITNVEEMYEEILKKTCVYYESMIPKLFREFDISEELLNLDKITVRFSIDNPIEDNNKDQNKDGNSLLNYSVEELESVLAEAKNRGIENG